MCLAIKIVTPGQAIETGGVCVLRSEAYLSADPASTETSSGSTGGHSEVQMALHQLYHIEERTPRGEATRPNKQLSPLARGHLSLSLRRGVGRIRQSTFLMCLQTCRGKASRHYQALLQVREDREKIALWSHSCIVLFLKFTKAPRL